jgi:hypothetical protein
MRISRDYPFLRASGYEPPLINTFYINPMAISFLVTPSQFHRSVMEEAVRLIAATKNKCYELGSKLVEFNRVKFSG